MHDALCQASFIDEQGEQKGGQITTPVVFEAFGNFAKPILLEQQQMQV